jgi:photosystem II stability/assembly factor-like uncharacterized protein
MLQRAKLVSVFVVATCWAALAAGDNPDKPWQAIKLPEAVMERTLHGIFFLDAKQGWIVGEKGLCLTTRDGGATWQVVETGSGATLRFVRFRDDKTGWICGDGDPQAPKTGGHVILNRPLKAGTLLATTDAGKTWQTHWLPTNFDITCVETAAAPVLQIGVSGGENHLDGDITRSPDGGKTWKSNRCYRALFAVRAVTDKRWVAVGSPVSVGFFPAPQSEQYTSKATRALYSDDGGETWKISKSSDGKGSLRGLADRKGKALLAVGDRGTILRSTDAGTSWEAVASTITENLTDVAWGGEGAAAVGHKGTVVISNDDGKTWKMVPTGSAVVLHRVAVAGDKVFVVGEKGIVLQVELSKLK